MKYLEVTFTTHPCNETVNDVVSALAGEIGFESFVECEAGVQAYLFYLRFLHYLVIMILQCNFERFCMSNAV